MALIVNQYYLFNKIFNKMNATWVREKCSYEEILFVTNSSDWTLRLWMEEKLRAPLRKTCSAGQPRLEPPATLKRTLWIINLHNHTITSPEGNHQILIYGRGGHEGRPFLWTSSSITFSRVTHVHSSFSSRSCWTTVDHLGAFNIFRGDRMR